MQIKDLTIEVRDVTLARVGTITPKWIDFKAKVLHNGVGDWELTLPATHPMATVLSTPGSGIVVSLYGVEKFSGPTTQPVRSTDRQNPDGSYTFNGLTDDVLLADALAFPEPADADPTTQGNANDTRSGNAETVMRAFVSANIGPTAPAGRKVGFRNAITLATNQNRGINIVKSARFDNLGVLLGEIATVANLGFQVIQRGTNLVFEVLDVVDRSSTVRLDINNGTMTKETLAVSPPSITQAIVAGQGEGVLRQFVNRTSTASVASEPIWGRRIEKFIDQRNTSDLTELQQAGDKLLTESGFTATAVKALPADDQTMKYGIDWEVGDTVGLVTFGQETKATTTAAVIVANSTTVAIGASIGDVTGFDASTAESKRVEDTARRVDALERSGLALKWNDAEGTYEFVLKGGNVTLQIGQEQVAYVKNNTGALLANGSAVYPNGSTGTNNLVALAQANAEATSTQTFGVLTEDIANGSHGYVTTFGMVHDINTSALTEGQPVWLSPTVAGGLTSTKPSAPNHMVLIGFCVRSHAVNGSIFVKVQNGFELNELHDVAISSPAANQYLVRKADNTGWENRTLTISAGDISAGTLPVVRGGTGSSTGANLVPTGGTTGQVLTKTAGTDYSVGWAEQRLENFIHNGAFDVWQRGTGFQLSNTGAPIIPDRWHCYSDQANTGVWLDQGTPLPGVSLNNLTWQTSNAAGANFYHWQLIETRDTVRLAGQTVTLSMWLMCGSSFSVNWDVRYSTSNDAAWNSAYTVIGQPVMGTLGGTWTRYSYTFTVPSNARTLWVGFMRSATVPQYAFWRMTGAQLEIGSVPTAFQRNGGSVANDTLSCYRFYYASSHRRGGILMGNGSNYRFWPVQFPVAMRTTPSVSMGYTQGIEGLTATGGQGWYGIGNPWTEANSDSYTASAEI